METEDECVLRFYKINMVPVKHALETSATVQRRQDSEAVVKVSNNETMEKLLKNPVIKAWLEKHKIPFEE